MNVLMIPSWYPTKEKPLYGIFVKEQASLLASFFPELNIGVSLWGQGDEGHLIWARDHFKNLKKIVLFDSAIQSRQSVSINLTEYFSPALTWSRKFLGGNINGIIKANLNNLRNFEKDFGKVKLLHAHVSHPGGYVAMLLSRELKIPYIITEHMGPFPFNNYFDRKGNLSKYVREPLERSNLNIAVSHSLADRISSFNIPRPIYIPNFINDDFFRPSIEINSTKPFRFFTNGHIIYEKGILHLLSAFKKLLTETDAELVIAGNGENKLFFERFCFQEGLEEKVNWLGEISRGEIVKQLQKCNAFILPSLHESFSVSVLEAVACGKPVVSTRCGGPESIINLNNGILVETDNPSSLHAGMQQMISNYSAFDHEKIRIDYLTRFSSKKVCKEIFDYYQKISISIS